MSEWTDERLRKIVEAQWGEARSQLVPIPSAGYLAQVCTKGHEHFVKVGAPSAEKAAGMLAAAVLAPDLWALVEAARRWRAAWEPAEEVPVGKASDFEGQVKELQAWAQERLQQREAAHKQILATLARLDGEGIEENK